jgi:hypothetical protein
MLEKRDYQEAVLAQGACNLSGIVHSFSEILSKIWDEAHEEKKGTDWVNNHPISVLFAEQITHLANAGKRDYFEAYKICTEKGES